MGGQVTKHVFISYAVQDATASDEVVSALEAAGIRVWIDRRAIRPGDSFVARMSEAISNASYLVLLLSQASIVSRWVSREWMAALANHETVLIPVLIERVELPHIIRDFHFVDLCEDRRAGLAELVRRLKDEDRPAVLDERSSSILAGASRYELRKVATHCVLETDFLAFLSDHAIPPGSIPGNSLHERLVHLIIALGVDGMIEDFARWLENERSACVREQLRRLRAAGVNFTPSAS